jgi:hypothetical protein
VCGGSKSVSSRSVAMVNPFVEWAAPIAAFMAITRRRADRACTVERSDSGRSTAEDGGRRLFCVAMQSALQGAAENSRRPPLQDANRLPSDRPLEGRARPLPTWEQSPRADPLDSSESGARSHRADPGWSN